MARGGRRENAGRKPRPVVEKIPAEPKAAGNPVAALGLDGRHIAELLPMLKEMTERVRGGKTPRTPEHNPFKLPAFPKGAIPEAKSGVMAMDEMPAFQSASSDWLSGGAFAAEGLAFLGYTYLAELAQRPEYRTMAETIADDATRRWIDFDVVGDEKQQREEREKDPAGFDERMADPDERKKRVEQNGKGDKVKALRDDQERLELRSRFYWASTYDSFMGRSHLYLQIGDANFNDVQGEMAASIGNGRDETSSTKVSPATPLKRIQNVEPMWAYPLGYNAQNPLAPDWYNPQTWYVMGRSIHISRMPTFIARQVPDMLKPAYAFGGLPLTQLAKPYVDIWLQTRQSVADMLKSFSVMVLQTDLAVQTQPGNATALLARALMFNMLRDNQGLFITNKNTEDFKNVSAPLGGLHELQAQSQEHMLSVARIPAVKFTGIQPAGLNASSEGEIKVYDDTIEAYQKRVLDPNLTRIINFQMLSLWGQVDPEISHRWEQLRQLTDAEKEEQNKKKAEGYQVYVDMGAISPAEVRKVLIDDPESPFAGLDPDDVPEPPAPEPGEGEVDGEGESGGEGEAAGGQGGGANDAGRPFGASDKAWSEADHPRGQPENAGQFGPGGGGGGKASRKYGGLYRQTGKGARADHLATVERVLKNPPRAGVSYRELLARLVKDAPALGGDVDQLKRHLGQAYENARQQLQIKALTAASHEDAVKFDAMAQRAKAKAEALGWKPPSPAAKAWAADGDASPELRGFREQAQRDLVERGIRTGLEDLDGFDLKTGKPVSLRMAVAQERSFVGFSPEMEKALMDPSNAIEMHHNHPGDGALSSADLDVLQMAPGMTRVYAHGHDGSVYWASGARPNVGNACRAASEALYYPILGVKGVSMAERNWLLPYVANLAVKEAGFLDELGIVPRPEMAAVVARHEQEIKSLVGKAVGWIEKKGLRA